MALPIVPESAGRPLPNPHPVEKGLPIRPLPPFSSTNATGRRIPQSHPSPSLSCPRSGFLDILVVSFPFSLSAKRFSCLSMQQNSRVATGRPAVGPYHTSPTPFRFHGPDRAGPSPSKTKPFRHSRATRTLPLPLSSMPWTPGTVLLLVHQQIPSKPFLSAKRLSLFSCRFPPFPSIRVHSWFQTVPHHGGPPGGRPLPPVPHSIPFFTPPTSGALPFAFICAFRQRAGKTGIRDRGVRGRRSRSGRASFPGRWRWCRWSRRRAAACGAGGRARVLRSSRG